MKPERLHLQVALNHSAAIVLFLFVLLAGSQLHAANKVVVIPLLVSSAKPISNIVTVAKENGDFTDPIAAIASITDASTENPYIVFIAPGIYTLNSQLRMKQHVDVMGNGKTATILTGDISAPKLGSAAALVQLKINSTISNVTIRNLITDNSNQYIVGVSDIGGGIVRDCLITVEGGDSMATGEAYGIYAERGLYNYNDQFERVHHCEIIVRSGLGSATGIFAKAGGVSMRNNILIVGCDDGSATGIKFPGVNGGQYTIERSEIHVSPGIPDLGPVNYAGIEYGAGDLDILHTIIKIQNEASQNARGVFQTTNSSHVNIRNSLIKVWNPFQETPSMSISGVAGASTIVSQSTLIGAIDGESTKRCVASGNGSGVALNPDCTIPQ